MSWLQAPLLRALRVPTDAAGFRPQDWELAILQGRSSQLLGRLVGKLRHAGVEPPPAVRRHFTAMDSIVQRQHGAVRWEVGRIAHAVAATGVPVTLLKGTAYVMTQAPAAPGRIFSDVDILVPKANLDAVEKALLVHGWVSAAPGAYDQRYYRQWMHELPPMVHMHRRVALDVHHNILPETARIRTRPDLILASKRALAGYDNIFVPAPIDLILHSACHLFHEGEWEHGLRDLSDLDLLMREYAAGDEAFAALEARARELNLMLPLSYAVRCVHHIFQTPLPAGAIDRMRSGRWLDSMFLGAVRCAHHSLVGPSTRSMQALLYVRSHWLRMPLHLLLPHLLHQLVARDTKVKNDKKA